MVRPVRSTEVVSSATTGPHNAGLEPAYPVAGVLR
jgi:hypothetical protein